MLLGLLDPNPDTLVGDTDTDSNPDPSVIKQKWKERRVGSFSKRYGSANPGPYQNVADPQHCKPQTTGKNFV